MNDGVRKRGLCPALFMVTPALPSGVWRTSPKLLPVNIHATCSSKQMLKKQCFCSPVLILPPPPPRSLCLQGGVSSECLWTDDPCSSPSSDEDLSVDKVTVRGFNLDSATETICWEVFIVGHFLWTRSTSDTASPSSGPTLTTLDCWLSLTKLPLFSAQLSMHHLAVTETFKGHNIKDNSSDTDSASTICAATVSTLLRAGQPIPGWCVAW